MKRFVSILLVAVMLVMAFTIPAYASSETTTQWKYYDKVVKYLKENRIGPEPMLYSEEYYHYADDTLQEPEWTLIVCVEDLNLITRDTVALDDIFIVSTGDKSNFSDTRYVLYVTALDDFLRVDYRDIDLILEHCPDFVKTMKEKKYCVYRGDINDDFVVDVIDATYIQRFIAGYRDSVYVREDVLKNYTLNRSVEEIVNDKISDYDYDGKTTILDATAIQMKLAKVEG